MIHFSRRAFLFIVFLVFCFMVLPLFADSAQAEVAAFTRVYGMVVDDASRPIPNVHIIFWARIGTKEGTIAKTKTNASGGYDVEIVGSGSYEVYAFCNDESTPGFDFVPAFRKVSLNGASKNISFVLLPGASINVTGDLQDLRSLEFTLPPKAVDFSVIDQFGLLNETDSVTEYGRLFLINRILNLTSRTVVVPSGMPVKIKVNLYYSLGSVRQLTIDDKGGYLNLTQGSQITVDLQPFMSRANIDYVQARLQSVQAMVDQAVEAGFYASYESIRLSGAEDLVKSADSALTEGDHDDVYANLHEALLIAEDVEKGLPSICVNVSQSVFFITPFLGFTAVAVASVLFDGMRRRLITSLALYGVLLGLLYFLYPGYIILQKTAYNPWAATIFEGILVPLLIGASFLAAFFVIQVLPRAFREKTSMEGLKFMSAIAAAFSVAGRNLRRRRLRVFLTSAFMFTSVFAFVVLTSFSFEQGFFIQSHHGQAPTEGFLMRKRPIGETTPFMPIEPTVLQWLENRPESALVVPKIENTPQVGTNAPPPPLADLYAPNSSSSFAISGVLGVYPSLEFKVTKMDDIVAQGRFFGDGDLNGILISEEAAETLQVEVDTTLKFYDRSFIVTGIFNSKKLGELKDLDGAPLVPQQIIITPSPMGLFPRVEYVPNERVAIMHGETAKNLNMVISRIDVQTQSPEDTMDLARLAVLVWSDAEAFVSLAGKLQHLFIGSAYVVKGFAEGMVLLVLVVLNVGVMMLGAVYERKREAFTMSTVGLNPLHVSAVFVAEALTLSVVAGSLGYLLGLISYRFFAVFAVSVEVKQKVEAFWGLLALSFSIVAAVLGTALPATKASIVATPSLLRKWKIRIEEKPRNAREPWVLEIPLRIRREDLGKFFSFLEKRLEGYTLNVVERVENLRISREGKAEPRLSFTYIYTEEGLVTDNELMPVKSDISNQYAFKLTVQSRIYKMGSYSGKAHDEAHIRRTAAFIRHLILGYSYRPEV